MPDQFIRTTDDVLTMLDGLLAQTSDRAWWDEFFADRSRRCPFLVDWPDESLAGWFGDGLLTPGRVLELGCGNGRNAAYLASLGCRVDAVDFSAQAIEARTARHAYWFPLVLFGLLSCASVPFYISATTPPATGVAILRPSAGPSLLGGVMPGRNGNPPRLVLGGRAARRLPAHVCLVPAAHPPGGPERPGPRRHDHRHPAGRPGAPG